MDITQHECRHGFWHFNNTLLSDPIFTEERQTLNKSLFNDLLNYANLNGMNVDNLKRNLKPYNALPQPDHQRILKTI